MEYPVGDEILAGAVALYDGLDQILGHVGIVGQQLLGILRQTVAAISERWIIVEGADARVQSHTRYDGLGVESLHLGIGVQLVEVAYPERQVGVGEEFHRLCLCETHEEGVDVLLDGSLLQEFCEEMRRLVEPIISCRSAHDDAARVEIVVERLALAQEFGGEDDVLAAHLPAYVLGVAHWDGALDDHDGIWVHLLDQLDDLFYMRCVEVVLHGVVVGWRGDYHEVGIPVGFGCIGGSPEVELFLCQVFLDVFVLDRRAAVVDEFHLFGNHIHCHHLVMLAQQRGDAQSYIACSGYGYLYVFFCHYLFNI